MIWHVIGWVAMAWVLGTGAGAGCYLWNVGRRPWSYQRPVPVPKYDPAVYELRLTNSSDVGVV